MNFLTMLRIGLFLVLLVSGIQAQDQNAKPPAPPPPLQKEQVFDMVSSGLNSVDILVEAKSRGLAFVLTPEIIKELEERGGDDLLLNWVGLYSVQLQSLYSTCLAEQQQKRYGRLVEVATDLLNRSPRLLHIYLIRGSAYRAQNQNEKAAEDFRHALKIHKNSSRARVLLAETLIAQNQAKEAIEELNWVTGHTSAAGMQDWPTAHRLLAEALLQQRDYAAASRALHTALWQLPLPNAEAVALLPPLENHMSALSRLLALCPDPSVAAPAASIELANLLKLMAVGGEQQQVALWRLAEGQAASGEFGEAAATQKAIEILASGPALETIRERLAMYQMKQLPLLPAGTGNFDVPSQSPIKAKISKTNWEERMKRFETKGEGDKTKAFHIGIHEVTRGEWAQVMDLPEPRQGELPMDRISWDDCQAFLKKLNDKSGGKGVRFRLPTYTEWRVAARGESQQEYQYGDDPAALGSYGWFIENSQRQLHKGGLLRESESGLFDLHGNVAEWCEDEVAFGTEANAAKLPVKFRRVAGGSYLSSGSGCGISVEGGVRQNEVRRGMGLRLAADVSESQAPAETPQETVDAKTPASNSRAGLSLAIDYARNALETEVYQRAWVQEKLFVLLYLQACVRAGMQDVETASNNLRALIREMPEDNSALMQLTRCHLAWIQATRPDATPEQIAEAKKIVETALTRSEFRLWIGYLTQSAVLMAEGNSEEAERRATQAADLAPQAFKSLCESQLKAIRDKKSSMTREFPISPSVPPPVVLGQ